MAVTVTKWGVGGSVSETVGVGATVATGTDRSYLGDGDYATWVYGVVLMADGSLKNVSGSEITVDASAAVLAAAEVAKVAAAKVAAANAAKGRAWNVKLAAETVEKGMAVVVSKKRAKGAGTVGVVKWLGVGKKFGYYDRPALRAGLAVEGVEGLWYTAASNLTVTGGNEDALAAAEDAANDAEVAAGEAWDAVVAAKVAAVAALAGVAAVAVVASAA